MKKFFAIAFIAAALVSCGGDDKATTEGGEKGDTNQVAPPPVTNDTAAKVTPDTTTKVAEDTTKKPQ